MMDDYASLKKELVQINQDISSLFVAAASIPGLSDASFDNWQNTCRAIAKLIEEETVRVGVVGPIKSGKSSFVNSLLGGDFLKRGAGVVTSIVTRVRRGPSLRATLYFKFWDEVNSDIEQALVLFPSLNWRTQQDRFEIRREKEREALQHALSSLDAEQLITNETRDINSVLLVSYLKGYERIKELISSDNLIKIYDKNHFSAHRDFVGDDSLSVYLKDIQLEIDFEQVSDNVEIADCQGSDSPNPLHIAKIQDYLLLTHLLVYVISSRTGLRQADIKFLSMIKKMGIIDNILFVVNCDFNEHASFEDLNALVDKVREELALIKPEPKIYTLSALFNLFNKQKDHLSEKDSLRLSQWEDEPSLAGFSDNETARFESDFKEMLTKERYSLLLKNHLERLGVISSGIRQWLRINQDILSRDADSAREVIDKIKLSQERMNQIKTMIRSTLDGAVQKIKSELRTDVDRFFDLRTGAVLGDIIGFIRHYHVDYDAYAKNLETSNFTNTLYLVFQEFKQAIDAFMAEKTNPKIIQFIREEEIRIKGFLDSILLPYDSMVQEAIEDFNTAVGSFGVSLASIGKDRTGSPDFQSIKEMMGLKLPPSDATMRYSAKIKTEAVIRLGFYSLVKVVKKLLKKPLKDEKEQEIRALKDGIKRMKRETEKSVIAHFKDYRENIKFQYIFKLVEAASNHLYQRLMDRFEAYVTDLSKTVDKVDETRFDRTETVGMLKDMELSAARIDERVSRMRDQIEKVLQH
jgi:Dynamin family